MEQVIFLNEEVVGVLKRLEDNKVRKVKHEDSIISLKRENNKLCIKYMFMEVNSDLYEMKVVIDLENSIISHAEAFGLCGKVECKEILMNMDDELNRIVSIMNDEGDIV